MILDPITVDQNATIGDALSLWLNIKLAEFLWWIALKN